MKNKFVKYVVIILIIILVSNIPIVSFFISLYTGNITSKGPDAHFISGEGGFSVWGRDGYEDIVKQFEAYKLAHPSDTVLYRNFRIKPWQFWRIFEYIMAPSYRLEYKEPPANLTYEDIIK